MFGFRLFFWNFPGFCLDFPFAHYKYQNSLNFKTKTYKKDMREQINGNTPFIDASQIYGGSLADSNKLRTNKNGQLKTSQGVEGASKCPYMPTNKTSGSVLFYAGDGRANENMGLSAVHTLFLREHNRIAAALSAANNWNDETTYQETRRIVQAIYQNIVFNEFVPELMGSFYAQNLSISSSGLYSQGYDPNVSPLISSEFATAAYRHGHTLIRNQLNRFANGGATMALNLSSVLDNTTPAYKFGLN
jgi:hypothetical protein